MVAANSAPVAGPGAAAPSAEEQPPRTVEERSPEQETALLRALGMTEPPEYPQAGQVYPWTAEEFSRALESLSVYFGRAAIRFGDPPPLSSSCRQRPRRSYLRVQCRCHELCSFFIQSREIPPSVNDDDDDDDERGDGDRRGPSQEVVGFRPHSCSREDHARRSLCSADFLRFLLREETLPGVSGSMGYRRVLYFIRYLKEKFNLDFSSTERRNSLLAFLQQRQQQQQHSSDIGSEGAKGNSNEDESCLVSPTRVTVIQNIPANKNGEIPPKVSDDAESTQYSVESPQGSSVNVTIGNVDKSLEEPEDSLALDGDKNGKKATRKSDVGSGAVGGGENKVAPPARIEEGPPPGQTESRRTRQRRVSTLDACNVVKGFDEGKQSEKRSRPRGGGVPSGGLVTPEEGRRRNPKRRRSSAGYDFRDESVAVPKMAMASSSSSPWTAVNVQVMAGSLKLFAGEAILRAEDAFPGKRRRRQRERGRRIAPWELHENGPAEATDKFNAVLDRYEELVSSGICELCLFGYGMGSAKAAVEAKINELRERLGDDDALAAGESEIDRKSLRELASYTDQERLIWQKEKSDDENKRLQFNYNARNRKRSPYEVEVAAFALRPVRMLGGTNDRTRSTNPRCKLGATCGLCHPRDAGVIRGGGMKEGNDGEAGSLLLAPGFRRFNVYDDGMGDDDGDGSAAQSTRSLPRRALAQRKKLATTLMALNDVRGSLLFIEDFYKLPSS